MVVQVLQFKARPQRDGDWTQAEIAEFYRVESALVQAGLQLDTERGVTDEGEPWFIFCRRDTGEVFIHFARIDGEYVIDGAAYEGIARGRDFKSLVRDLIGGELVTLAKPRPRGANVFLHPAALLIALVGASFFHSGKADAAELTDHRPEPRRHGAALVNLFGNAGGEALPLGLDPVQTATVLAGVIIGLDQQQALPQALQLPAGVDSARAAFDLALSQLRTAAFDPSAAAFATPHAQPPATEPAMLVARVVTPSLELSPAPATHAAAEDQPAGITAPPAVIHEQTSQDLTAPVQARGDQPFLLAAAQPAPLPEDQAAAVVESASGGDHRILSLTGQLPSVITDLIGHGQHVAAQPSPPAGAPSDGAASPPARDVVPGAGAPAGREAAVPAPPSVAPPAQAPEASNSPPAAPPPTHDQAIDAAVSAFMAEATHWEVIVQGRDLVVYDTQIFGHLAPNTVLDSVTFTFSDGSAVSLVGTAQEIQGAYHGM